MCDAGSVLLMILLAWSTIVVAAPGSLDTSFGSGGVVQRNVSLASAEDGGRNLLRQPDGKLILEGECYTEEGVRRVCLTRYLANGELDVTFNASGKVIAPFDWVCGRLAALWLNSKIYGYSGCTNGGILSRLNVDGSFDGTFGTAGALGVPAGMLPGSIADQGGKLIVAGSCPDISGYKPCVMRFDANGQLDTSFGVGGTATSPYGGIVVVGVDNVVVAGSCGNRPSTLQNQPMLTDICVARFQNDGAPDLTFNGTGKGAYVVTAGRHAVIGAALDGDQIVVGATCGLTYDTTPSPTAFCVVRIATNGALDTSFNGSGKAIASIVPIYSGAQSMALDGSRIVMGGSCWTDTQHMCAARFNADGTLDMTFNGNGKVVLPNFTAEVLPAFAYGVQIDNGAVVLGGGCWNPDDEDFCVVRLTASGALDPLFNGSGRVVTPMGILPGEDHLTSVARFNDGKIIAAGFCNIGTSAFFYDHLCVAKFNADGSPDTSFKGTGRTFTPIGGISRAVAVTTVGDKAVVAGYCTANNEYNYDFCVVRYLANGELDPGFNGTGVVKVDFGGGHDYPGAIKMDGSRILVTGYCNFANTVGYRFCALRINENGQLDPTFGVGGKVDVAAWTIAPSNGIYIVGDKIYVPANCESSPWQACLFRLNANGTPDENFGAGGRILTNIVLLRDYDQVFATFDGSAIIFAGNCLTAGNQHSCVIRLKLDGAVDLNYGANAQATASLFGSFRDVVVANGKATVVGTCNGAEYCMARFDPNGAPDLGFGNVGVAKLFEFSVQRREPIAMVLDGQRLLVGVYCQGLVSIDFCLSRVDNQAAPGQPQLVQALGLDGKIAVSFSPPLFAVDGAITEYRLVCDNGAGLTTSTISPIQVSGLTNGTTYQCALSAANTYGAGGGITFAVTPSATSPALLNVVSRKQHGMIGPFDLAVDYLQPIAGPISVEPRAAAASHKIVFQFSSAINSVGVPMVTGVDGLPLGSATAMANVNEIEVTLSGVSDTRRAKVTVPGINGGQAVVSASLGFLVGDVYNARIVGSVGTTAVKSRAGQILESGATTQDFRFDLNTSGSVTAADISAIKARVGRSLQPPLQ